MPKTHLVIIPTYNEVENIRDIIKAIKQLSMDFAVLVVDDNSPDGTALQVELLQQKYADVFLEIRPQKNGLGKAYLHGFEWALRNNYDYIYEIDADFSHSPADLIRLRNTLEQGYDVAIGSRYVKGGGLQNWPLSRKLLSKGASLYVRTITRMPIYDPTAGFVGYTRETLQSICHAKIEFVGYAFQVEMKYKAYRMGCKIKEIPITFTDRIKGKSKMNGSIISEGIWGVLKMACCKGKH